VYILCCNGTCTVRAPCHMFLTVLNEQLTHKKYRIRLTKYISVLIHNHISLSLSLSHTHTHTHTHIHLCLCLPFYNTAIIKYHQFNQMQLTYRYLSIYVFSFLWHRVLHLSYDIVSYIFQLLWVSLQGQSIAYYRK